MSDVDQLLRTVQGLVGDDLRAVIQFDRGSFALAYCRDDLDQGVFRELFKASRDELILRQMQLDDDDSPGLLASRQAATAGDLPCLSYWTERAIIIQLPDGRYSGTVVSIEPETDVALGELCEAFDQRLATA